MSKWVRIDDPDAPVYYVNMGWPNYSVRLWLKGKPVKKTYEMTKDQYKVWVKELKKRGFTEGTTIGGSNASTTGQIPIKGRFRGWYNGNASAELLPGV